MRKSCIGCPCLEPKDFCFWYQNNRSPELDGCGNSFEEKPEFNQEESEEICYNPDYNIASCKEMEEWCKSGEEGMDKLFQNVKDSEERFRQHKACKTKGIK